MSSLLGRGAQVKITERQRAATRGVAGRSLLDNILAKRVQEDRDEIADGLGPDASWGPDGGTGALDEVLAPNGEPAGYLPGPGPGPGTGAGGLAAGATIACRAGFAVSNQGAAGTAVSAVSFACSSALAAAAAGAVPAGFEIACRSALEAKALPNGLGAFALACRSRFGANTVDIDCASGFSARAAGTAYAAFGPGPHAGWANSPEPANSSLPANTGGDAGRILGARSALSFGATAGVASAGAAVACVSGFSAAAVANTAPPLPDGAFVLRDGSTLQLRDGSTLVGRPNLGRVLVGRDGLPFQLRNGTLLALDTYQYDVFVGRDGKPFQLRDGSLLGVRLAPDPPPPPVVAPDPPPVVQPPPTSVVWPAGAHIRFQPTNGAAVVLRQDGRSIDLRLVRPLWEGTGFGTFDVFNASVAATNVFTSGNPEAEHFGFMSGQLIVTHEVTAEHDGAYGFTVYRGLADGGFVEIPVTVTIAANAAIQNPTPTPDVAFNKKVFLETFPRDRRFGALWKTWQGQRIINTAQDTLLLDGSEKTLLPDGSYDVPGCSCMNVNSYPPGDRSTVYGFGYGDFEVRARFLGDDTGERSGPAIILWPSDDVWPGQEWDLGEIMGDGTFYHARHWKDPATGQDRNELWAPKDQPSKFPGFNHRDWHVHALRHEPGRVTFFIDGKVLFTATTNLEADGANGGVNHTIGLQSGSAFDRNGNRSGLECSAVKWTPLALAPAVYAPSTDL